MELYCSRSCPKRLPFVHVHPHRGAVVTPSTPSSPSPPLLPHPLSEDSRLAYSRFTHSFFSPPKAGSLCFRQGVPLGLPFSSSSFVIESGFLCCCCCCLLFFRISDIRLSSVQFSSGWSLCARKSPYTLHPVSQRFPQRCDVPMFV